MKPLFLGTVNTNGKLELYEKERFLDYVRTFSSREVQVTVGLIEKPRSNQENKYYWGCVLKTLGIEYGYYPEEMHEVLKNMFLMDNSRKFPIAKSTKKLSTVEFEEYLSRIRQWAAEQGVLIPLPNEIDME